MIKLKYGRTNTYYLNGLLIDTDMPETFSAFCRELKANDLKLSDVGYVIATHYHPDHVGLISKLKEHGVKHIIIDRQLPYIHFSDGIFEKSKAKDHVPLCEENAIVVSAENSREFLKSIGISGEILATESHSEDGIAIILDGGEAFVGDLEPIKFIAGYEDNAALESDWKRISAAGAKVAYFGHINEQAL